MIMMVILLFSSQPEFILLFGEHPSSGFSKNCMLFAYQIKCECNQQFDHSNVLRVMDQTHIVVFSS